MTIAEAGARPAPDRGWLLPEWMAIAGRPVLQLCAVYLLLLAIHAYLGGWSPEFLGGRSLWHFWFSRMIVPMVMFGCFAAFARPLPAGAMLGAGLLFVGTLSRIKKNATGEPFQISDLFLAGQSVHLLHYVHWHHWLLAALIVPAGIWYVRNLRIRRWSLPVALCCAGLLSTYRIEAVANWIHDNSYWVGVENLTFSQAESERMNGLGTHLYFSTAGLRLKTYTAAEVKQAMDALAVPKPPVAAAAGTPAPDLYIILGEAWWHDPDDARSPLNQLKDWGFTESMAVSPVYGGTTPNSEFEVLTGIPVKTFQDGIIPYQHYVQYITGRARGLPRILSEKGYAATAYHNFTRRFWLRDQIYPKLGFDDFVSMDQMTLTIQPNDWPTDEGLYRSVLARIGGSRPEFHFIVTVQTHGPYEPDDADPRGHEGVHDYRTRLTGAAQSLAAFKKQLDAKGRPYALVLFGDHLPGLRMHQFHNGMVSEQDPRLHQIPVLIASNTRKPRALAEAIHGRPLYCLAPLVLDWIGQPTNETYLNYLDARCRGAGDPMVRPAEAVIQNQLFSRN
ncbi:LTA synthase family protein [Aestuariivirga sp.]|uniref:LTA synthase family protein n=1 Tax=Aestuariivirga sp. TaxID=2650926 RepID=UPI0025BE55E0|nr:alkaline phosphatase family protein [Aestuariivirga sp.]MCA3555960.1 sulfatase-like hydrolase/transferase [Aestuariivirga sp.]